MGRTKESGGKNNGMSVNYAEVIEYVKKMTSENGRPSNYPFRSRFEHTMRVYRWAIKLQSKLGKGSCFSVFCRNDIEKDKNVHNEKKNGCSC